MCIERKIIMTNGRIKKIIALFMSLVFSFGILSSDVISIKGYAETDFNQIAHDQNLQKQIWKEKRKAEFRAMFLNSNRVSGYYY